MLSLLIMTISTSAIDSLNPVAITQQFLLQGLVKKKHHIWFYIMATAIVNFIVGIFVYFGLAGIFKKYLDMLISKYSQLFYISELMIGIVLLITVSYIIMNKKIKMLENKITVLNGDIVESVGENEDFLRGLSLNPLSLFLIGSVATICELPSALPFFAFLTIILNCELPVIYVILLMFLYNFIYSSPLMLLYLLYVKSQEKVDRFYELLKEKMSKYSDILTPLVVGGIGLFLIYHSMINLLS